MKTIKIIDLLNKISKGEEAPKKIKFNDHIYEYRDYTYCDVNVSVQNIECYLFSKWNFNILNDEVEIIEEDKENKIEKIEKMFSLYLIDSKIDCESKDGLNDIINELIKKVDEIIDYLESKEKRE